jgi:hypothetical protein
MRVEVVTKVYAGNDGCRKGKMFRKMLAVWVRCWAEPSFPGAAATFNWRSQRKLEKATAAKLTLFFILQARMKVDTQI